MATVRLSGLPMLPKQIAVLEQKLNSTCMSKQEDEWYFIRHQLEKIAKPFEGTELEDAVEWMPNTGQVLNRVDQKVRSRDETALRDEFLKPLVVAGWFVSLEAADMIWSIFISRMKDHTINTQKPVPMGFCHLYAFPYRANWKQMVLQHDLPKFHQSGRKTPYSMAALADRNVAYALPEERLTSWHQDDRRIEWTLEAIPTEDWFSSVKLAEDAKAKKGFPMYMFGTMDTMKRLIPYSLKVYADYLERICRPHCILGARYTDRHGRLTPLSRKHRGKTVKSVPTRGEPITLGPESDGPNRPSTDSDVRDLFCFSPPNTALRRTNGEMAEPLDEQGGSLGMPMPDGQSVQV